MMPDAPILPVFFKFNSKCLNKYYSAVFFQCVFEQEFEKLLWMYFCIKFIFLMFCMKAEDRKQEEAFT
jgi:hypothetical protein